MIQAVTTTINTPKAVSIRIESPKLISPSFRAVHQITQQVLVRVSYALDAGVTPHRLLGS